MNLTSEKRSLPGYLNELSQVPITLKKLCHYVEADGKSLFIEIADQIRKTQEAFVFGMASSQWASWPMVLELRDFGIRVQWMSCYEGLQIPSSCFSKESLVILVSQSGETIEVKRLLERISKFPYKPLVVGVTNSQASYLALKADIVLDILAGPENHVPTKTYVNSIAALILLYSFVITRAHKLNYTNELISILLEIASRIKKSHNSWKSWGEETAGSCFKQRGPIQFLATGRQLASAWQASMVCSETTKTFSATLDWATFRHGFELQVDESFVAIGFKPSRPETSVWHTTTQSIRKRGGQVFLVPDLLWQNETSERYGHFDRDLISTIWETLPIHCFCMNLAQRKGLDPSQIERKVMLDL